MARTLGQFLANVFADMKRLPTIQYPESGANYSDRFRGRHILKTREDGTLRCVACYMCETACPADCIHIEAGEHPVLAYEKYPPSFEIDLLRCVLCGFCVDACPKDAIWMTKDYEMSYFDRQERDLRHRRADGEAVGHGGGRPGLRLPPLLRREPDEEGGGVRAIGPLPPSDDAGAERRDQPDPASAAEAPGSALPRRRAAAKPAA